MNRRLQNTLITIHRWIGIVACLYLVIWFCSGAVIMYVHFPKLMPEERLGALQVLDWSQVRVEPNAALAQMELREYPREFSLEMSKGAPLYRAIDWQKNHYAVSAVDGQVIREVTAREAELIAAEFGSSSFARVEGDAFQRDLWSVITERGTNLRPFYRVSLDEAGDRKLYVSSVTGEIVLDTTRRERLWNYVGAVPHWLYYGSLRSHQEVWRWVVMSAAIFGLFVTVTGLWLGITFIRLRKRYPRGKTSPFRGWMKWHHVIGTFGGFVVLTWLVSGWLSAGPNGWLVQRGLNQAELQRYAGQTAPRVDVPSLAALAAQAEGARIVRFLWTDGKQTVWLSRTSPNDAVLDAASGAAVRFSDAQIFEAARRLIPTSQTVATKRLDEPDEYWHDGFLRRPTPMLRVQFDDEAHTWYHIDPRTAEVVALLDDTGRDNRWWFEAIHDLDLHFLTRNRPLWDVTLLALLAVGLAISVSGVVLGWRRLRSYQRN